MSKFESTENKHESKVYSPEKDNIMDEDDVDSQLKPTVKQPKVLKLPRSRTSSIVPIEEETFSETNDFINNETREYNKPIVKSKPEWKSNFVGDDVQKVDRWKPLKHKLKAIVGFKSKPKQKKLLAARIDNNSSEDEKSKPKKKSPVKKILQYNPREEENIQLSDFKVEKRSFSFFNNYHSKSYEPTKEINKMNQVEISPKKFMDT